MDSLDDAWSESERRRQEVAIRDLMFHDLDYEEAMEQFSKEFKEKGHAILHLPEHVKMRMNRDSLYVMQPVLNHYRQLRGASPIYII